MVSIDRRHAMIGLAIASTLHVVSARTNAANPDIETWPLWHDLPPDPPPGLPPEQIIDRTKSGGLTDRAVIHVRRPRLEIFRPKYPNGAALLIIPGGGYERVVMDKEGYETALFAAALGLTAFVLIYRLPGDGWADRTDISLQDARRALTMIRARASELSLDTARIGVMGFSAGGHVAAKLAFTSDAPSRPDYACLVYPVVTMKAPIAHTGSVKALFDGRDDPALLQSQCVEDHVQDGSPPTILFHASDDTSVPAENTLMLYNALRAHSVVADLHIFAEGGHGFGLRAIQGKPVAAWPTLFSQWAKRQGMWG